MAPSTDTCPVCGERLFRPLTVEVFGPGCVACAIASWSPERRRLAEAAVLKTARSESAAAELAALLAIGH